MLRVSDTPSRQYGIWLSARDKTTSSEGGVTNGFADLSNWFEIHNVAGRQIDQGSALTLSPGKLAGVAVGGFATGALVAGVVMFAFTRRRAARRESAMTPLGRRESDDSVMVEKQRLALRDKSAY